MTSDRAGRETGDPVLFHVHGLGPYDFSSLAPEDLPALDRLARDRGVCLVPTVFLRQDWLGEFEDLLRRYHDERERYGNILGFAMEGPLLGPEGGTPRTASWFPDEHEWRAIAALGELGLKYIVIAPDALEVEDEVCPGLTLEALLRAFYDSDVRVALGHFLHADPELSARRIQRLLAFVADLVGPSQCNVLTDHLYNDMPRSFRHAWRGASEQQRDRELAAFLHTPWTPETVDGLLGPVPGALLGAARDGYLMPCMNFDGQHVDLAICRRTVEYLGAENLIAISDHTETPSMAGEPLRAMPGSSLWLRGDGIVAAGSSDAGAQERNMRAIGMTDDEIAAVLCHNPRRALASLRVVHG